MEEMIVIRQQTNQSKSAARRSASAVSLCRDSHVTTKPKLRPKIRIVHIFAPEIIETDIENFRELVQRLTGKPAGGSSHGKTESSRIMKTKKEMRILCANDVNVKNYECEGLLEDGEKEEKEEIWSRQIINSSGLYDGQEDLDCFIHSLIQCPLNPLDHDQDLFEAG